MKNLAFVLWLLSSALVDAAVLNVEFKFTPYTGDTKNDQVDSVAGTARVVLNGVAVAEQPVSAQSLPVLFDAREIGPAVWVPVASLGPAVRKGKNSIRIEFEPADAALSYKAQLRWATVTDQTSRTESGEGQVSETNQTGEGGEEKQGKGKIAFEREFTADFAQDLPWHHYPVITAVEDKDRQALADLVKARAEIYKPKFEAVYTLLAAKPGVEVPRVRKAKCLDAAYKAGVRVPAPPADQLEFGVSGNPEVVVRRKGGDLFTFDPSQFQRIKGDDTQMCAGMVLEMVFPRQMVVVRNPAGAWEVVY
jgi:hypothetical protein